MAIVAGDVKLFPVPNTQSAAAAAVADAIIIHVLAVVVVVMAGLIHGVYDQPAIFFNPDVRAAADGAFGGDKRQSIHAVRDAVAFPREIVVTFRNETRKS